ncbi:MAG: NRDE family protein [Acidimicrobiales bacterium]|jgi:uncharacterized protein with NRDE domain
MCLLVVVSRLDPGAPLVVGANRDERLDRPAAAMTVLRPADPRILGGRDEEAGGTWLAVNEHGVVAGLTNRPSPEGRDPAKRSRGELPLALAAHRDASSAVEDFVARCSPSRYNPAWLLVGDRTSLYALDMTGSVEDLPLVEALHPGVHILENTALHTPSPKADHVRALLGDTSALAGENLVDRLRSVLGDHTIPVTTGPEPEDEVPGRGPRPVETLAACVHTETYGTRSSTLVRVPAPSSRHPQVLVADGHPCTSAYVDMTDLFQA